jgi:hypothetical protein
MKNAALMEVVTVGLKELQDWSSSTTGVSGWTQHPR